jgi:hypothetical protein
MSGRSRLLSLLKSFSVYIGAVLASLRSLLLLSVRRAFRLATQLVRGPWCACLSVFMSGRSQAAVSYRVTAYYAAVRCSAGVDSSFSIWRRAFRFATSSVRVLVAQVLSVFKTVARKRCLLLMLLCLAGPSVWCWRR